MSLLIDALKKYRQETTASLASAETIVANKIPQGLKAKKIVCISLITVIVIALTATVSFLVFKHIEKKRITHVVEGKIAKVEKIKALLEEKKTAGAGASEAPGALRERLKQRMQQEGENEAPAENSASTASDDTTPATADAASAATVAPPPATTSDERPRARMAERRAHRAGDNSENNNTSDSSTDTSASSSNTDDSNNTDDSSNSDSSDSSSSNEGVKVDIQVVPDQIGANNSTYQQALGYMQVNQYDKALDLLVNNDDLLLKTQGLSALLLARIYLTTGEYELADQVLDHALMLHVGSDMDLLGLRAQALFMQKKYQETVDLLSSQSPDLSISPGYYALLADTYMHLDQASNAVSVFQQIVARFPNSPDYWLGLAVAYQKTGDASSALVAYRRAAQLSPDDPQVTLFINQQIQALQAI